MKVVIGILSALLFASASPIKDLSERALAEVSADPSRGWRCLSGLSSPIRLGSKGEIECMSLNARDCLWGGNCATTLQNNVNNAALRPLVCGTDHKAKYGGTGYDTANHWCVAGWQQLKNNWVCLDGINTPVRLSPTTGDVECASNDGTNCLWQSSAAACESVIPTTTVKPLTCGLPHLAKYNGNGYSTSGHWCLNALNKFTEGYRCGLNAPIGWDGANIRCASTNGRDCLWTSSINECYNGYIKYKTTGTLRPLVCGAAHKAQWGGFGYENPDHWCFKSFPVQGAYPKP